MQSIYGSGSGNGKDDKAKDQKLPPKTPLIHHTQSAPNLVALERTASSNKNLDQTAGEIIVGQDQVTLLLTKIGKTTPQVLQKLKKDAATLHDFMTYPCSIKKDNQGIPGNEEPYALDAKDLPDAFFVFGNNDLHVMDKVAQCYSACEKHGVTPFIFVSGLGGHATASGHLFGKSEAETIRHRLLTLGIPEDKIIIETKAKNSGENVKLTDAIMKQHANKFPHILIFGSPTNVGRQIRTYEQQSTYDWKRISTLPATAQEIEKIYYKNNRKAAINFLATLCEVGKFLSYTLNENFMSARAVPDEKKLMASATLFFEYYNLMTNHTFDTSLLTRQFMDAYQQSIQARNDASGNAELIAHELKRRQSTVIAKWVKEMDNYFRVVFQMIEKQWMPAIPQHLSMWEQDQRMNKSYSKIGADTPRGKHSPTPF